MAVNYFIQIPISYTNLSGSNIMQVMLVRSGKLRIEALN